MKSINTNVIMRSWGIIFLLKKSKRAVPSDTERKHITMAVCFFGRDYKEEHKYKCEYEVLGDQISVAVDYNIMDEIEAVNGVKSFGINTTYDNRDILIIDQEQKVNYLLKNAYYNGVSTVYGSPDGGSKTKFKADMIFSSKSYQALADLKETPKINSITIVSKDLNRLVPDSSINMINYEDKLVINLNKDSNGETRRIGSLNIKEITLRDYWSGGFDKSQDLSFVITGELEIKLIRRVNYTEIPKYVYEVLVFLQLYTKNRFKLDEIKVSIDGVRFNMMFHIRKGYIPANRKYIGQNSVQCNVMEFLEKCYSHIPYRKSKSDIRNIPYIILKSDRSLEDSFLMYYRFIECYYKRQSIPDITSRFISYSLNNNYVSTGKTLPVEAEVLANEIITLRNHYVHSGYFIKNECLKIKTGNSGKSYTVKADVKWIYERTKILYDCSIDIILRDMLGFENYSFS